VNISKQSYQQSAIGFQQQKLAFTDGISFDLLLRGPIKKILA
jgi:hypothetical protein